MVEVVRLENAATNADAEDLLASIASTVGRSKKILVITGAGISCNAGIPDFRSENGLYQMVKKDYPDVVFKGKDLFDSLLFRDPASISVFCTFIARLRSCILGAKSTAVHKFIKLLHDKKKLLRCYTQNIDGLESQDGLRLGVEGKSANVVQLHGDIHMLKCTLCNNKYSWSSNHIKSLSKGIIPECPQCFSKAEERQNAGKRGTSIGVLRPNIVLYGEEHPDGEDIGKCINSDFRAKPDCLIIMGTSLKVIGIKSLARRAAKFVHERKGKVIYINRTPLSRSTWNDVIDYHIESDCDQWVEDLKTRQSEIFLKQSSLTCSPTKLKQSKKTLTSTTKVTIKSLCEGTTSALDSTTQKKATNQQKRKSSKDKEEDKTLQPIINSSSIKPTISTTYINNKRRKVSNNSITVCESMTPITFAIPQAV
ncbi:DHS-like NAD/FAD-binding domain-containing protein [Dipodascopsis uninucleata]